MVIISQNRKLSCVVALTLYADSEGKGERKDETLSDRGQAELVTTLYT